MNRPAPPYLPRILAELDLGPAAAPRTGLGAGQVAADACARIAAAFHIDTRFREEYRALRVLLRLHGGAWSPGFIGTLERVGALRDPFGLADRQALAALIDAHAQLVAHGRFDQDYVASVSALAAAFARHGVDPLWVTAAYHDLTRALMGLILSHDSMADRLLRRDAYRCLAAWIAIETGLVAHFLGGGTGPR